MGQPNSPRHELTPARDRVCDVCQVKPAGVVIGCVEYCGGCALEQWEKEMGGEIDEEEEAA